jgi:hypothetical protein
VCERERERERESVTQGRSVVRVERWAGQAVRYGKEYEPNPGKCTKQIVSFPWGVGMERAGGTSLYHFKYSHVRCLFFQWHLLLL